MADEKQFLGDDQHVVHHTSARKRRGLESANMNLNLTSMIDVIFLLLIYFVITANFAVGEGVIMTNTTSGSGPSEKKLEKEEPLKVYIASGGIDPASYSIRVEGSSHTPRNFSELREVLEGMQLNASQPNGTQKQSDPIIITPEGTVVWGHVVNGFNAAIGAKYSNVQFGTPDGG